MKSLESNDPFELVGVNPPRGLDIETDRETARCLIEEYALTGFSARDIVELFASPAYTMPNAISATVAVSPCWHTWTGRKATGWWKPRWNLWPG